jgi:hypothetical protein
MAVTEAIEKVCTLVLEGIKVAFGRLMQEAIDEALVNYERK